MFCASLRGAAKRAHRLRRREDRHPGAGTSLRRSSDGTRAAHAPRVRVHPARNASNTVGAFDVRRGKPFGFTSHAHDSDTFIELLDVIDTVYPPGRGHIIMDNLSAHDTPDVNEWFDEHPRWKRHFTPKHASWLHQIECWFSIIGRQLLARGSFTSQEDLAAKIDAYVAWYLQTDRPFHWSYRPKSWSQSRQPSADRCS